jgi:hypothetical protein
MGLSLLSLLLALSRSRNATALKAPLNADDLDICVDDALIQNFLDRCTAVGLWDIPGCRSSCTVGEWTCGFTSCDWYQDSGMDLFGACIRGNRKCTVQMYDSTGCSITCSTILSSGGIAGIVIASVVVFVIFPIIFGCICCHRVIPAMCCRACACCRCYGPGRAAAEAELSASRLQV